MSAVKDTWVYGDDKDTVVLPGGKPSRTKKMTGTRLGGVLGINPFKSDFQMWCEICKVAEPKFEGNKFTEAGNAIEPILVEYMKNELETEILTPEQYWGALYPERKYGFFPNDPIFDGMWDGLELSAADKARAIVECKTAQAKNRQYWEDGPPAYYLVQAALYAKLQGVEKVIFPVAFLEEGDYAHPEQFVCTESNTRFWFYDLDEILVNIDGQLYNIDGMMSLAAEWYDAHVRTGVSPKFDEKKDAEYLKILRTNNVTNDSSIDMLLGQIKALEATIDQVTTAAGLKDLEKALKKSKDGLKDMLAASLGDTDTIADAGDWRLTRSITRKVNETAMKDAGVFEKYSDEVESLRLAKKPKEKE